MATAFLFSEIRFFDLLILFFAVFAFVAEIRLNRQGEAVRRPAVFKKIFWASVGAVAGYYLFLTYLQFLVWKASGPITRFFLPPHTGWWFLFDYQFMRFLLYYLISFFVALILVWLMPGLNRRFGGRFFESEERWLGALGIFLSSYPGWLIYLGTVLGIQCLRMVWDRLRHGISRRLSFYYLWLPAAMFVIMLRIFGVIG